MKKLIAIVLLCACLIGTAIAADPNAPLPSMLENMTCVEVIELYDEAGALYQVSGERMYAARSKPVKQFWGYIRQLTLSLHQPLLEARSQKCKAA